MAVLRGIGGVAAVPLRVGDEHVARAELSPRCPDLEKRVAILLRMAQIKIHGIRDCLRPRREQVSDAIHASVVEALQYPPEKRAHRFFYFERDDYLYPPAPGRSDDYTIIEISMFEGRSVEAKKLLVALLFERLHREAGLAPAMSRSRSPKPRVTSGAYAE